MGPPEKGHPYEKYITVRMMDRFIQPDDTILDIGGGPGYYSIHYAGVGHAVTLLTEMSWPKARKKSGWPGMITR